MSCSTDCVKSVEMRTEVERAKDLIERTSDFAVVGHARPDGDAIGSMLALTLSLWELGKSAVPVLAGGLPGRFKFLPGSEAVVRALPEEDQLIIAVDAADLERLGFEDVGSIAINLDHHPTNTRYAAVNLVLPETAATTELLYQLAPELGLPINQEIATNLLLGLVTDTIGFRTPSVTPETLRIAAELVERGADLTEVYRKGLIQRRVEAVRYWGAGLKRLERDRELVWASLSLKDRRETGYHGPDDADLIDVLTTIQEARVAMIFVEQKDQQVKVSWRAHAGIDVAELATKFGGGGHRLAAGATVSGTLEQVREQIVAATQAAMMDAAA
jgi:phosphoesterase RecJ-like protein